jgi:hypothetical protein
MKCPKCKTVIPSARPILRPSERKLSAVLQLFADAIGVEAALAIAREYGGQKRYFPSRKYIEAGHPSWLVDVIGREKAAQLGDAIGGEEFNIPRGPERGASRYLEVKEAHELGFSTSEIAALLGMHRRTVFYHISAIRQEKAAQQQPADQGKR